ncbi:hypothetical protein HYH02_002607 [Chlamydomonas schloesseri]|uniref:Pyrrolo-quinoline quinone repeat domain-containing protein n=1 Tax=Chlamydomonas schloesseri TaxID=2026947 RepID=A0A835WSB6_9CHLO|nr:hypothetical protein HYH02_002607 [Chlamydomonas schloesseri]|eukprot:KAG2453284.1 hypothetical protein HYH02_002607 [Chlamydomonas schloesseri]
MLTTEMTGGAVVVAGDDSVACFEPNGQLRWLDSWQQPFEVMAGGKVYTYNNYGGTPIALDPKQPVIYVGLAYTGVKALDLATGATLWITPSLVNRVGLVDMILAAQDLVYLNTNDFKLIALDAATGRVVWGNEFRRWPSPQMGYFKGLLIRPDYDGMVWGINGTDGRVKWQFKAKGSTVNTELPDQLPIDPQSGLFYVSDDSGFLYAVNARTGAMAWTSTFTETIENARFRRAVQALWKGVLFVQPMGWLDDPPYLGKLDALNATTGELLWRKQYGPGTCGFVMTDNEIVFGSMPYGGPELQLTALDERFNEVWRVRSRGRYCESPLMSLGGTLYVLQTIMPDSDNAIPGAFLPTSRDGFPLALWAMPLQAGQQCPHGKGGAAGSGVEQSLPPSRPPSPPSPSSPPPVASPIPRCWTSTSPALLLGAPATDGVRVYAQDNRGVCIATYLETGIVAWRANVGEGLAYPANLLVADGIVFVGGADRTIRGLNASTGIELWRVDVGVKPGMGIITGGFYGLPAYDKGVLYIGASDGILYALNGSTGQELWVYVALPYHMDSLRLMDGIIYTVAHTGEYIADQEKARYLALNATDGTVLISRDENGFTSESGVVNIIDGVLIAGFATPTTNDLRAFTTGPGGGDLAWTAPEITDTAIESILVVKDVADPLISEGVIFFGNDAGEVMALRLRDQSLWWKVDLKEVAIRQEIPLPRIWIQPTYSAGRLYVATSVGLFVLDAATGEFLWGDLRNRTPAKVLVLEHAEGPQVIYLRYLNYMESRTAACPPGGAAGGISSLALAEEKGPAAPSPKPTPSPAAGSQTSSPTPLPGSSSPQEIPLPSRTPSPSPLPSPSPSPSLPKPQQPAGGSSCPVCPPAAAANCSSAPQPQPPTQSPAAHELAVSIVLGAVPAPLLKLDRSSQDQVAAAVAKAIGAKLLGSSGRVQVTGVAYSGGSSSTQATVRLLVSGLRRGDAAADAAAALEEAVLGGKLLRAVASPHGKAGSGGVLAYAVVKTMIAMVQ